MNISTNSQPIATKVCQRMERDTKVHPFYAKNDFLKIVTYDLVVLMRRSVLCTVGTFFDMSTANDGFGHFAEF